MAARESHVMSLGKKPRFCALRLLRKRPSLPPNHAT